MAFANVPVMGGPEEKVAVTFAPDNKSAELPPLLVEARSLSTPKFRKLAGTKPLKVKVSTELRDASGGEVTAIPVLDEAIVNGKPVCAEGSKFSPAGPRSIVSPVKFCPEVEL